MGASVSGSGGSRRDRRQMAEINVTPLVDVMLVLLIISMIAAPMLQQSMNLDLPETVSSDPVEEAQFVVSIDRESKLRINDRPIHPDLLEERMRTLAASRPDETVYIRADKLLTYGEVLWVMDRIRTAGLTRIALVSVPLDEDGG